MLKSSLKENLLRGAKLKLRDGQMDALHLSEYCISEGFSADLESGTIVLGERTSAAHGLRDSNCGLLALTRCYSHQDRLRVLNILEQATKASSRFSFHTTIQRDDGMQIPVLCTGETLVCNEGKMGRIKGVFVFSKALLH